MFQSTDSVPNQIKEDGLTNWHHYAADKPTRLHVYSDIINLVQMKMSMHRLLLQLVPLYPEATMRLWSRACSRSPTGRYEMWMNERHPSHWRNAGSPHQDGSHSEAD